MLFLFGGLGNEVGCGDHLFIIVLCFWFLF